MAIAGSRRPGATCRGPDFRAAAIPADQPTPMLPKLAFNLPCEERPRRPADWLNPRRFRIARTSMAGTSTVVTRTWTSFPSTQSTASLKLAMIRPPALGFRRFIVRVFFIAPSSSGTPRPNGATVSSSRSARPWSPPQFPHAAGLRGGARLRMDPPVSVPIVPKLRPAVCGHTRAARGEPHRLTQAAQARLRRTQAEMRRALCSRPSSRCLL